MTPEQDMLCAVGQTYSRRLDIPPDLRLRDVYRQLLLSLWRSATGAVGLALLAVAVALSSSRGQWLAAMVLIAAGATIYLRLSSVVYLVVVAFKRRRSVPR